MTRDDRSDETDGLERLLRTHRRIEERLQQLVHAAAAVADPERRYEALQDLLDAIRFFGRAARRHHEDEELSLFPRVAGLDGVAAVVKRLQEEHLEHDGAFDSLRILADSWDPDEGPSRADEARLPGLAHQLAELYTAHIAREERELFPAVRAMLSPEAITEMGLEMIARRR